MFTPSCMSYSSLSWILWCCLPKSPFSFLTKSLIPWVEFVLTKPCWLFYHFSGCFRPPLFSCSLLLKYINAWCHSLWLIKLPLWVTAVWLGGKWHPELQADSEEADFTCDPMPGIDPGSTKEDIKEMILGFLPNGPCQRQGGRWLLVLVAAWESACLHCLPFLYQYHSLAWTSQYRAGWMHNSRGNSNILADNASWSIVVDYSSLPLNTSNQETWN